MLFQKCQDVLSVFLVKKCKEIRIKKKLIIYLLLFIIIAQFY